MFKIEIDKERCSLTATLDGTWDIAMVDRYAMDLRKAAQSIAGRSLAPRWLVDLINSPGQVREVMERFT